MKKRSKYILAGVVVLVFLIMVIHFANTKTFRGRVIDADTKEPIEGAVVVAAWYKARDTIAGESTSLKDVKECLTDKSGKWLIRGSKGRNDWPIPYLSLFIPYLREPEFIIFKPGYCSWPNGFDIDSCRGRIKPGGTGEIMEGTVIELPKLTKREDRLRTEAISEPAGEGVDDKLRELHRLLNEERRNLGLREIHY